MKKLVFLLFTLLLILNINAQNSAKEKGLNSITKELVKAQLEFLASDWMEGRETGTKGQYMAADYIASMFKVYGLKPAGDLTKTEMSYRDWMKGKLPGTYQSYFQNFNLVKYKTGNNNQLRIVTGGEPVTMNFKYKTDFSVTTTDISQHIKSEIVFAGYGYVNDELGYDDFEDVDVKGKVVLVLDGFPGHSDTSSAAYKKFKPEGKWWKWRLIRERNKTLQKLGAACVIRVDITNDNIERFISNLPFRYNEEYYEGTEPLRNYDEEYILAGNEITERLNTIYLSNRALNELLKNTNLDLKKFETDIAQNPEPRSKTLKNKILELTTDVDSKIIATRNVLAKIEGEIEDSVIVIGGHYDHDGIRKEYIYNGSDDNASGTVGVMTLATSFMESGVKPKYTLVFAAWSGEEKGLLGSKYYVENLDQPVLLYLNYDMISKNDPDETTGNKASFKYTDLYPSLKEMVERANTEYNFELEIEYDGSPQPGGGSDHSPFAQKDIPIIYYMAGFPDEYHTPFDHANKTNYDKMLKIIKLGYLNIWDVANKIVELKKN